MIYKLKKGNLIRFTSGPYSGKYATATSDPYTHRFMDSNDWEMVSHGMGEYAGSYGAAFSIVFSDGGTRRNLDPAKNRFEIITEELRSTAKEA